MAFPRLILASVSPRRRDLLRENGFAFEVRPANIIETIPAHLTVCESVLLNAKRKAADVAGRISVPGQVIVGVDTLVSFEDRTLGKPADLEEAFEMISLLSGRTHTVISGVWMIDQPRRQHGFVEITEVTFREISPEEIRQYHSIIDPLDKAGAYAAQQDLIGLIESINGSRTNVIGFPIERFREVLLEF